MARRFGMATCVTIGVLILSLAVAAGVNLSGTWVRDKEKSDPMGMGRGGGRPGGGGGGAPADMEVTLQMTQTDNELTVVRKVTAGGQERPPVEQKFTLDGKENTNPSGMRGGEMTSKSKWDKDKLIISGTSKVNTQQGEFEIQSTEEYSLSADGKVLTVSTTRSTPMGEQTSKQVYNKQ